MNIMMVDCESLGLKPDAVLLQIAVGCYDLEAGKMIAQKVFWPDLDEQVENGRRADPETVLWWLKQSDHARQAVSILPEGVARRMRIFDIKYNMLQMQEDARCKTIWAAPAATDLTWLKSYFGHEPWSYTTERCMSTIKRLFDPEGQLQPSSDPERAHDAAYDVEWQCTYLHRLYKATNGFTISK